MDVSKEFLIKGLEQNFNRVLEELKNDTIGDYNLSSKNNSLFCKAELNGDSFINIEITYGGKKLALNDIKTLGDTFIDLYHYKYIETQRTLYFVDVDLQDQYEFHKDTYLTFNGELYVVEDSTPVNEYSKFYTYINSFMEAQHIGRDGYGRNFVFTKNAVDVIKINYVDKEKLWKVMYII